MFLAQSDLGLVGSFTTRRGRLPLFCSPTPTMETTNVLIANSKKEAGIAEDFLESPDNN